MQTQFQYITELGKQYRLYSEQPDMLYQAINELPQNIVEDIYKEYGDSESKFQPVNLLRVEINESFYCLYSSEQRFIYLLCEE